MASNELKELKEIYKRYGFTLSKSYQNETVLVFTLKNGYFDNADIVNFGNDAETERAFKEFSEIGYACTVRKFTSLIQAEEQLFKGFFSVDSTLDRLKNDYTKFTSSIVSLYVDSSSGSSSGLKYQYINAPYLINDEPGISSPYKEVIDRLGQDKPILFLVEAAAGFGKTCTAYELVNTLAHQGKYLPLFSELARNRQATIFRYILLDAIDTTFPLLGSRLVQSEILNGRVVTVLDGFDELLRKGEEPGEFESQEPMLETIGEMLKGKAKVVLTTRKTILFEGDAFYSWVEKHENEFELVTIKISEPRIDDWLPEERLDAIKKSGLELENISNPVLLSYLRCISEEKFRNAVSNPNKLVDSYFNFMLEREITRQDLKMSPELQMSVLRNIASDMLELGYTSEHRDYIVELITSSSSKILENVLQNYPSSERLDKEQLANKLASHALLDRSSGEQDKIGFINEFVFGHFLADIVLTTSEWLNDDLRFIEPIVLSYKPRNVNNRRALWKKLNPSLEFVSPSDKFDIAIKLIKEIEFDISDNEIESLVIENITVGSTKLTNVQFNDCTFKNCKFNAENFNNVTFLNCRFYNNELTSTITNGNIYVLGGIGDQDFITQLASSSPPSSQPIEEDKQHEIDKFILEKFWPVGREHISYKHRPIKGVCGNNQYFSSKELYDGINSLKKRGILLEPIKAQFVEINFEAINEIKEILDRQ